MTIDNASAAVSLVNIAKASQQLIATATSYAKTVKHARNSHIQLEGQLQRIVAASNLALGAVNKSSESSLSDDHAIDRCLVEWLSSDEPHNCFNTLEAVEKLIKEPLSRPFFRNILSVSKEDRIKEAIMFFNTHRPSFHFLLTMDIWNRGKGAVQDCKPDSDGGLNVDGKYAQGNEQVRNNIKTRTKVIEQEQEITADRAVSTGPNGIQLDQSEVSVDTTTVGKMLAAAGKEQKKQVDQNAVADFLRWLNGSSCTKKHEDTCALRQAETCTWLPETEMYQSWRHGDIPSLWLEGKPGSGKSVLASSVIEELKSSQRDGEVLAFFYCDFRNEWSTSATEVMRSLLTQLLRLADVDSVDCRDAVPELAKRKAEGTEPPSDIKLLTSLMRQVAHQLHRKPLIIIDALDECKDVEKLLDAVKELNDGYIRLFVTSRPERIIRDTLSDLPSISLQEMRDAVSADMERHITTELDSRRWLRILEPKLKKEILSALLARADGMFRWVQCQIDTLAKCPSAGEIRTALKSLPSGLDETYERILRTIDGHGSQRTLVQRVLVWLVAALQPLYLSDIMAALKIDLEKRTLDDDIVPTHKIVLLDACGSLVTHYVETDIIFLSHFSVKEYLTGELIRAQLPQYYIGSEEYAHEQLARLCICYMSLVGPLWESVKNESSIRLRLTANTAISSDTAECSLDEEFLDILLLFRPLFRYALFHGFSHLAHLGSEHDLVFHDMKALESAIQQFPRRWTRIRDTLSTEFGSSPCYMYNWSDLRHDFMLYILVCFGSVSLLESYLDRDDLMPNAGTNPLVYAVHLRKAQHAQVLLSRGARVNDLGWAVDRPCQNLPLEVAIKEGVVELVDLLLAAESRVIPEQLFETSVSLAFPPLRVIRSLFQTDEFAEWAINCQDKPSLLHHVLGGHYLAEEEDDLVEVTRRLIQVGYDPAAYNSSHETPLDIAVANGYVFMAEYLISITHPHALPSTILLVAARGRIDPARMTQMLIDKGADVYVRTSNGDGVLHVAIKSHIASHNTLPSLAEKFLEDALVETVKILIHSGCNPAVCNSDGQTPLHVAASEGHISVVEYMLSLDILLPPDILLSAARATILRAGMIKFLIDKGADVHARTPGGDSVLHVAYDSFEASPWHCLGHGVEDFVKVVDILVRSGCSPAVRNSNGKMLIHAAVARRDIVVVQHLIALFRDTPLPSDVLVAAMELPPSYEREKIKTMLINSRFRRDISH